MSGAGSLALVSLAAFAAALTLRLEWVDELGARRADVEEQAEDVLVSPGPEALGAVAMGHELALADLFWLGLVQEFGRTIDGQRPRYGRVERWTNIATDFDPLYFIVYYGSAIHLTAYAKDPEASDRVLHKGARHLPHVWQFPFMLGYNAYFLRGRAMDAAAHWRDSVGLPGAPRFLPSLAARARLQAGTPEAAEAMLVEMLESGMLEGPQLEDAGIRLQIIRSEPVLRAYDAACAAHRAAHGRVPRALELYLGGQVPIEPVDRLGAFIELDEDCRARTQYVQVREDEAVERIGSQADRAPE